MSEEIEEKRAGFLRFGEADTRIMGNRCGAQIKPGMERERWREWITELEEMHRQMQWIKADAYAFAHLEYGAAYIRAMSPEGFSYRAKMIHTANLFPQSRRNPNVPFTHYVTVYEYGVGDQRSALRLIDKAALNGWTKTRLKAEIQKQGSIKDPSFKGAAEPGYECFQKAVTFLKTHPADRMDEQTAIQLYNRVRPLQDLIKELEVQVRRSRAISMSQYED